MVEVEWKINYAISRALQIKVQLMFMEIRHYGISKRVTNILFRLDLFNKTFLMFFLRLSGEVIWQRSLSPLENYLTNLIKQFNKIHILSSFLVLKKSMLFGLSNLMSRYKSCYLPPPPMQGGDGWTL